MRYVLFSYGSVGDALMWLNVFRQIHVAEPDAELAILATRNDALLKDIARGYPYVTIAALSPWRLLAAAVPRGTRTTFILPPTFGRTPFRLRIATSLISWLPYIRIIQFAMHGAPRRNETPYDLSETFYCNIARIHPAVDPSDQALSYEYEPSPTLLTSLALERNRYIVVHPFAANPARSLPPDRWHALVDYIAHAHPSCKIVIHAGPKDEDGARAIAEGYDAVVCGPALSFSEKATLIANARLYVGVDTGITHLAALLKQKMVVIGNRSNPTWLPTYNSRAVILFNEKDCTCNGDKSGDCRVSVGGKEYLRCLYTIPQARIEAAISEALE